MHHSRLKAIRGSAAAVLLSLFTAGCETDGETVPTRTAAASVPPAAAETDTAPAKLDKPAAATESVTNAPATTPTTNAPVVTLADTNATAATTTTNATPVITEEIPAARPANLKISEATEKVIKLAESNLDEQVLLGFVQQTSTKFELDADEIVYLSDVGVPSKVIAAMLKHDGDDPAKAEVVTDAADTELAQPAIPAATNVPPAAVDPAQQVVEVTTNYVPNQTVVVQQPQTIVVEQQPTVVYAQPETVSYFYNSLSPYGSWFYVTDYGWCWQPTVAVIDRGWRPYGHRGNWVWTTSGWYWHSDYSWGWAPFHYGRWHLAGARGWIWVPDRVWGPAWVSWRSSGDYCGWAPLPPHARFTPGLGFTYFGRGVDISFGFGLGYDAYCFAPINRFHHRRVWDYCLPRHDVHRVYAHSRIANRWEYRHDRREFVNRGVSRVEQGQKPAVVRDMSERDRSRWGNRDRVDRRNSETVVYRPAPPDNSSANISGDRDRSGRGPNGGPRNGANVVSRPSTTASGIASPAPQPQNVSPTRVERNRQSVGTAPVATTPSTVVGSPTRAPQAQTINPVMRDRGTLTTRPAQTANAPIVSLPAPTPAPITSSPVVPQSRVETAPSRINRPANQAGQPQVLDPATRRPVATAPSTSTLPGAEVRPAPAAQAPIVQNPISRREVTSRPAMPQVTTPSPSTTAPQITPQISRTPPRAVTPSPSYAAPIRSAPSAPTYAPPAVTRAPAPSYSAPIRSAPSNPSYAAPSRAPAPAPSAAPISRAPAVTQTPVQRSEAPRQAGTPSQVSPNRRNRGD